MTTSELKTMTTQSFSYKTFVQRFGLKKIKHFKLTLPMCLIYIKHSIRVSKRLRLKRLTLKIHLLSFCKHLVTPAAAGTAGVIVFVPCLSTEHIRLYYIYSLSSTLQNSLTQTACYKETDSSMFCMCIM